MLRTLLVFAILVPGMAAALTNRFAALLLYLWFALFRPQEWVWIDVSRFRLSLMLGILLIVPCLATGVLPFVAHPISASALVFLFAGLTAQVGALDPGVGWQWVDYLMRLLLVCLLAITLVSSTRRFLLTVAVVAGSFGFHAAKAGLASMLGGGVRVYDGLAGAFGDNNGYAVGMAMVVPLLFLIAQNAPHRWIRYGFATAGLLTIFATFATFSRGGFLAVTAGAGVFVVLQRARIKAVVLMLILAVPLGAFMLSQEGYIDRLGTIRSYEETNETSALSRLYFWELALKMAIDRPLGVGLFNYEVAYDRYDYLGVYGQRRSVHSSHLQALAETGFLGAAAYASALTLGLVCTLRIRRRASHPTLTAEEQQVFATAGSALTASLVAFIVGGAFVAMALNDLLWLVLALVAALDRISRQSVERTEAPPATVETPLPRALGGSSWTPPKKVPA